VSGDPVTDVVESGAPTEETIVGNVIGQVLPLAIAITISPVPIIAVILLLFTERPKPNAAAFVVGFFGGVTVFLTILIAAASSQDLSESDSTASTASFWIKILLGVLLAFAAYRQLRKRPQPGEEPDEPKWMAGISSFTAGKSFGTGFAIGAVNPKNVAMSIAAAATISAGELGTGNEIATVVIYAVIASLGVVAPLVVAIFMGAKSTEVLDEWKAWLGQNNSVVMAVLFAVFAAVLIGKGIVGLTA
jgi:threonine/homoserine/homoserine lactone efflux protein